MTAKQTRKWMLVQHDLEQALEESEALLAAIKQQHAPSEIPEFGQFLLCLFVSPEKQVEKLADMEEMFSTIWAVKFSPGRARFIYMLHALGSAVHLVKSAVFVEISEKVLGLLQRVSGG